MTRACARLWVASSALFFALLLSGCPRPLPPEVPLVPTPTPAPTPPPPPYVPSKRLETGRLFNDIQYRVTLETEFGTAASLDREDPSSYSADLRVKVKVPLAQRELADIARLNPELPVVLPGFADLLKSAKISPFYEELYRLKVAKLRANLNRLDNLITRHNFFDTETVLELQDPKSKRRALFVQADMDVDEDGSDSDRVPEVDGSSVTFQPFTSYKWTKKTEVPNSFGNWREAKVHQYEQDLAKAGLSAIRTNELKQAMARLKSELSDLKRFSYLVASTDPYVVLPGSMVGRSKGPFAPLVGDYCVVIYGSVLYPAIIGDTGPDHQSGESSLRICKQINARSDSNNRPVNDLKVSYLVFPGSGDKPWETPNLEKWRTQCQKLLEEMGGFKGELFAWEDLTKPKPPLVPVDVPATPAVTPTAPVSPATPAPAKSTPATLAKSTTPTPPTPAPKGPPVAPQ